MAMETRSFEMTQQAVNEPLADHTFQRRMMVFAIIFFIPFAAMEVFARSNCGSSTWQSLPGKELHVISDVERFQKLQRAYGLGDSKEDLAVGQLAKVISTRAENYGEYYVEVRIGVEDLKLAPPCFEELWCSDGLLLTSNVIFAVALILFLLVFLTNVSEYRHQVQRHKTIAESLANNSGEIYRMIVSGQAAEHLTRVIYGPNSKLRWMAFKFFPFVELGLLVLVCLCLTFVPTFRMLYAIAFSALATGLVVFAIVVSLRFCLWFFCVIKYARRASSDQTFEITFCSMPEVEAVCVIYKRFIFWFCNVGTIADHIAMPRRNAMILARTQLLAHHRDPEDDTSPIMGWSLKVCYGRYFKKPPPQYRLGCCGFDPISGWHALHKEFPVDPAQIHDFQRWLADPSRRNWFRYEGVALQAQHALPWNLERLRDPLRRPDQLVEPEELQLTKVFSLRSVKEHGSQLSICLSAMGGEELPPLIAGKSDLVADLCYRVAVENHAGFQVKVALPDATTLDMLDRRLPLAEALKDFME